MRISDNVRRLPDAFCKSQDSNNAKILALNEGDIATLDTLFKQIDESLDIYKAEGKMLDLYGEMYEQKRGSLNDVKYRTLILARIATNTSGVDHQSIVNNLANILRCDPSEIQFIDREDLPATVEVKALPFVALGEMGFTSRQTKQIVKMLLPIAVNLIFDELQGTFEFAASADEYDEGKGFGNDEQTIGGTLGMMVGEDEEKDLPI